MEAHGTIGVWEFNTINRNEHLYRQVDIATFKPPAKNPECGTANTPYLKVLGIMSSVARDETTSKTTKG